MSKKTNYAWDTSVLIAWLAEEAAAPLDRIAQVVEEVDNQAANLTLSVLTFSELLETRTSAEQLDDFKRFLKRPNIIMANVTIPIAQTAGDIRSRGQKEHPPRKIKTPDAIILATALLHQANVLHTLDEKLLRLSGSSTVAGLVITLPQSATGQDVFTFCPQ